MAHGDAGLRALGEFREVAADRGVEFHFALLDELEHGGRRREHFGERGGVVDSVLGGGLACWLDRPLAHGPPVDGAGALHPNHSARRAPLGDGEADRRLHFGKFVRMKLG
jgi:hypothetical protein